MSSFSKSHLWGGFDSNSLVVDTLIRAPLLGSDLAEQISRVACDDLIYSQVWQYKQCCGAGRGGGDVVIQGPKDARFISRRPSPPSPYITRQGGHFRHFLRTGPDERHRVTQPLRNVTFPQSGRPTSSI
ncbi:hypothetical protein J6590_014567 [Homalodisca vitripennis]|nr:hypothetical protein J6590_014567 [Homalodisca vitripennis]